MTSGRSSPPFSSGPDGFNRVPGSPFAGEPSMGTFSSEHPFVTALKLRRDALLRSSAGWAKFADDDAADNCDTVASRLAKRHDGVSKLFVTPSEDKDFLHPIERKACGWFCSGYEAGRMGNLEYELAPTPRVENYPSDARCGVEVEPPWLTTLSASKDMWPYYKEPSRAFSEEPPLTLDDTSAAAAVAAAAAAAAVAAVAAAAVAAAAPFVVAVAALAVVETDSIVEVDAHSLMLPDLVTFALVSAAASPPSAVDFGAATASRRLVAVVAHAQNDAHNREMAGQVAVLLAVAAVSEDESAWMARAQTSCVGGADVFAAELGKPLLDSSSFFGVDSAAAQLSAALQVVRKKNCSTRTRGRGSLD